MINGKKLVVVLPAYNASQTLEKTYQEIPLQIVDEIVLVDDASKDNTIEVARNLGIRHVIRHEKNKGYGGNQKSCYNKARELDADIVITRREKPASVADVLRAAGLVQAEPEPMAEPVAAEEVAATEKQAGNERKAQRKESSSIRVDIEKIDVLLNLW